MKFQFVIYALLFSLLGWSQIATDSTEVIQTINKVNAILDQEQAIGLAKQAVKQAENCSLPTQVAAKRCLMKTYWKFNENYNGLRVFLELNNKLERLEKWQVIVENHEVLAEHYKEQGLFTTAIESYRKGEKIAFQHNVEIDQWKLKMQIGELLLKSNLPNDALPLFKEARNLAEYGNGDDSNERIILALRKQVEAHNMASRYWNAIQVNIELLGVMEKQGKDEAYTAQLNNIGYAFQKLGVSSSALTYFDQTLKEREKLGYSDKDHIELLINIAIAYQNLHEPAQSQEYLDRALAATQNLEQKAQINDLLAMAFLADDDVIRALQYNKTSIAQAKQVNNKSIEAESYYTASIIYEHSLNYVEALESYKKYRNIKDSLYVHEQVNKQKLLQAEYAIERTQGEIQSLIASNEIKDYEIQQLKLESENREKELKIKEAQAKAKLQALQLERSELEAEQERKENAILKAREENQRLQLEQRKLEEERAKQELEIAEEKNRVQKLQLERRRAATISLIFILLLALVLTVVMVIAWFQTRKKNKLLAESRELIKQERDRSDELLLNILPESTAKELKKAGRATPRNYESASVFFSDFVGFSSLSKNYSPEELIEELELFFGGFDNICAKYKVEKIKTIGDAYMCASGIPETSEDHAIRLVKAAMEMLEYSAQINEEQIKKGRTPWHLRIGINSGPVVAGVIGTNKFIYDVWGDTVNLASRLETASEPNRINISQHTLELIKQDVRCSFRGEIEVKNMGAIRMFFVENLRS